MELNLLPYQKAFIEDKSRLKILVKGRQIGGTFAVSYWVFERLMKTRNHNIMVCTRDERLAKEFVLNVKKWIQLWNLVMCKNKKKLISEKKINKLEIEMSHENGPSRLIAVSSNPNAIIGKSGDIILDEFAVAKDPELLWALAQPVINTSGGQCIVLSTQRGRNTKFNEIVEDAEKNSDSPWSLHKTTFEDAVEQGLLELVTNPRLEKLPDGEPFESREAFVKFTKGSVDEHSYSQEYMCIPSSEATDLLTEDELKNSFKKFCEEGSLPHGTTYLGYDVAESEHGDFATICVIREKDSEVEIIHSHYFPKGTKIDDQLDKVKKVAREYKVRKVIMDANGIGRYPTTVLQSKLGDTKVIGFVSSMNSKAEMYQKVKRFFQNGHVRMPEDDAIEQDFLSISRTITPSNNIVYSASRVSGSHGDMASAFSMAMTEVPELQPAKMKSVATTKPSPIDARDKLLEQARSLEEQRKRNRISDKKRKTNFI